MGSPSTCTSRNKYARLVFGTLYPAYASYKAVRTKNVREYVKWMMYWIVFALFSCAETFTDVFLSFWFPFYYEIKILLVLWLLSPATKGSSILYRKFVHPMLSRREQDIDEYIAKAKEQGYHTVLHLGTKGVNYATTVIMQTAIKGGGGLVQQLRRSYSLGDLSSDVDGDSSNGRKALPETQDRNRDRERVASDGRHHRPRGHSPRRSASGSGRVEMYFPEVDVDVRGTSVREPSVPLSHIRSSEDVSSGYSSAEPLYQQGGSVGGGPRGDGHHESLASSREPLVRTASVGGSSRSTRTRSSRGGGGTTGKKGSAAGVPEASEESSLGGEDSPHLNSPSPPHPRSRSNSLPISADLRPELIALLQALNAELEHGISMSKLAEIKTTAESMGTTEKRDDLEQRNTENSSRELNSLAELGRVSEKSKISVSSTCFSESSGINLSIGSDDIFYDSLCMSPTRLSEDCQVFNEDQDCAECYSEAMTEPQNVIATSSKETVSTESLLIPISLLSSEMFSQTSDQCEKTDNDIGSGIQKESLEIHSDRENGNNICEKIESTSSPTELNFCRESLTNALEEIDLHKNKEGKPYTSDNEANINLENSLQRHEPNSILHANCLYDEGDKGQAAAGEITHQECMTLENLNTKSDENYSGNFSEQILTYSNDENVLSGECITLEEKGERKIASSNDQIVTENSYGKIHSSNDEIVTKQKQEGNIISSHNQIVTKEKPKEKNVFLDDQTILEQKQDEKILSSNNQLVTDEKLQLEQKQDEKILSSNNQLVVDEKLQTVTDEVKCPTDNTVENICENSVGHKQLCLPSLSAMSMKKAQLVETAPLKNNEPNKSLDTKDVLIIRGSTSDYQTAANHNVCGNLDIIQEPKKDSRSGKYHKLQAPEPPQRTRRSSSKSSTSEESEVKSVHRSRSPRKAADSPVTKLHDQIENLAAMLPFWKSGKRPNGKEDGGSGEGFRIRQMSRSPSRRAGGQAPL